MVIKDFLKTFLVFLPIFLGIDLVWIGKIAKPFYDTAFSPFSRTLRWPAAIIVYILIPLGLMLLVLPKTDGKWWLGLIWGALYGLVVYGVYDLTNYALLTDWTLKLTLLDMVWGMVLNGTGGILLVLINQWLVK